MFVFIFFFASLLLSFVSWLLMWTWEKKKHTYIAIHSIIQFTIYLVIISHVIPDYSILWSKTLKHAFCWGVTEFAFKAFERFFQIKCNFFIWGFLGYTWSTTLKNILNGFQRTFIQLIHDLYCLAEPYNYEIKYSLSSLPKLLMEYKIHFSSSRMKKLKRPI